MSQTKFMLAKLRHGAAVAALAASALLAGAAHADNVLSGQTIRLIVVSDPVFKAMQKMHDDMEKMAGGKIELNVLPFDSLHQQVLLNSQNSESRYDIIAVDLPQWGIQELPLGPDPQGRIDGPFGFPGSGLGRCRS